ncbi:MAG: 3-hydroxyacyl-ACP dehydratase FabZ [Tissierellia bacterium]|jgi:3-hydroxyacyl-[acyl-carrier-protein] dehydratase|nr:3-hydroxyacyl-ACP dehydratase FabZ [Tissierellia bacterium]
MLNSNEIQKIIPHRYPMLLVDKIVDLEVGRKAVGIKGVTANEPFFQGHFPEYHVMPGVLIIEALAQVGAVALLSEEKFKGKIALFAGIKNAKFRKQVVPGDTLRLECELTRIKGPIGVGIATAYVEDEVAASAELTFAIK